MYIYTTPCNLSIQLYIHYVQDRERQKKRKNVFSQQKKNVKFVNKMTNLNSQNFGALNIIFDRTSQRHSGACNNNVQNVT